MTKYPARYWIVIAIIIVAGCKKVSLEPATAPVSFELKSFNINDPDSDTAEVHVAAVSPCNSDREEVPLTATFLSSMPGQVQDPEIISVGNKLVVPGWFSNFTGTISNKVYLYDIATNNWTTIFASLARIGVATISAGNKVYFAGGVSAEEDYTATAVVDIYDVTTNTWSVANLSEARGYCKAAVVGNKIFFAGGLKDNDVVSKKVDIYDIGTGTWSSTLLPGVAREVGAAITVQNKVFFCGGYTAYENPTGFGYVFTTPSNVIDVYNTNTGQWSTASMQIAKGSFSAINVNGKIYMAGGIANNAVTSLVDVLDANTMTNLQYCLYQPLVSYNGRNAAIKNDKLLLYTYTGFVGVDHKKFDIYNLQTGEWTVGVMQQGPMSASMLPTIAAVNNEVYAVINTSLYKMDF